MSWISFEPVLCILTLWPLYLYVITIRSWPGGVDRRPGRPEDPEGRTRKPEAPEDQEDYEDLSGSHPSAIEFLLGIAC